MNADKMNCVFVFCDEAECSIGLARVLPETSPSVEIGCFVIVTTCYGGPVACINMSGYRYKKMHLPEGRCTMLVSISFCYLFCCTEAPVLPGFAIDSRMEVSACIF